MQWFAVFLLVKIIIIISESRTEHVIPVINF